MQCEQFEAGQGRVLSDAATRQTEEGGDLEGSNDEAHSGLCKTCGKEGTCTHVRPRGGVLFCEEYE